MPDPRPLTVPALAASPRWAAGPEPATWRLLLTDGREVGRVESSNSSAASCKLPWHWWSHPHADPRLDRAEGWSYSPESARRACQGWVTGRLPSGAEEGGREG